MLGLLVPGVAHAAPPPNDDFDRATTITALPYRATQSVIEATQAPDDPTSCRSYRSVWFTYTATVSGRVAATTAGSDFDTTLSAFTGARGALSMFDCNDDADGARTSRVFFDVVAGTRYHFLVGSYSPEANGALTFSVDGPSAPVPANDAFADAEPVTALPHTAAVDATTATAEPGEPTSGCAVGGRSLWYAVTVPETTAVTLDPSDHRMSAAVFTGTDLADLVEVGCTRSGQMTFRATAGTTYHVRLTTTQATGPGQFTLSVAQPIQASFSYYPEAPSTFSEPRFEDHSAIPGGGQRTGVRWDFGDGTTSEDDHPAHRYAVDGDHPVTLTVTAADGRMGSTTRTVRVRTHDVAITRFTTPATAEVGTTKRITVRIANTRYAEDVTVALYRGTPRGWVAVGGYTQYVPVSATGAVDFPFNHTFSPEDASFGKVTFRAVAELSNGQDALPLDNEVISAATAVRPAVTGGLDPA